jgi:DHA1 family multidrug resistance protein-like MFS transporter
VPPRWPRRGSSPARPPAAPSPRPVAPVQEGPGPGPTAGHLLPLGLITFVFNLGGGIVAPALPLYARTLGGDYRDLGLIGASHGLAFAALTIPLGLLSDRLGRRALLLFSAIAVGGAAALYLAAAGVGGLVAGKLIEAAGWAAFWPALEAWVAERFGARAGAAMGLAYGAYAGAFVAGTSVAGFVVEAAGLRAPFVLYLAAAAVAVLLVAILAGPGSGPSLAGHGPAVTPRIVTQDPARARTQRVLAYATGFVYVYGLGTVLAFLPAFGADRGLAPRGVGLLLATYWVARVVGSVAAGQAGDVLGRRAVLVPAMAVSTVGAALVVAPLGAGALFVGAAGLGLTAGASAPSCVGLIADHVNAAERGVAMGLFEAACGVSILGSGLVGGFAAAALGGEAPYAIAGALTLGWTVVLMRALRPARPA